VAIPWIVPTLTTFGHLDGWLAGIALLLLAAYLALYSGLFVRLAAPLWRRGDALSLAALPAIWVALEWLRAHLISGFPWNVAAYSWTDVPGALPLASWIGAYGVSALVLVPALGVAHALRTRRWEPAVIGLLIPAALLPVAARFAVPRSGEGPPVDAWILQPNIPNHAYFDAAASEADYRRLLELSTQTCAPGRLLVWPESAAWPREWPEDPRLAADLQALVASGCSVLFNTPTVEGRSTYNSVVLLAPGAAPERGDKRHLVPFGEYVPLRRLLPFLGTIARMAGGFAPATELPILASGAERLGAAVCYEVIFPEEVAELVRGGATALVTVTNDAWYGDTAAPWQHLRAARFRAAESRRWMLRAAITGVSARIRPDGELAGTLGVGEEGAIPAPFLGRQDLSPYSRAPRLVPIAATLLALGMVLLERRRAAAAAAGQG
jgi:apolipoprotein N-acyltransferase